MQEDCVCFGAGTRGDVWLVLVDSDVCTICTLVRALSALLHIRTNVTLSSFTNDVQFLCLHEKYTRISRAHLYKNTRGKIGNFLEINN
jgi:hypothetical protein